MMKFLFLFSLCFLPFVAFSSTFTSENPIELPSATSAKLVLDVNGKALDPRASYRIVSTSRGAAGGDVFLGPSPTTNRCPDGVFRFNSDVGPSGTPVRFIPSGHAGPGIFEQQGINIQFSTATSRLCVDYTIWKVGDYDATLGATLLKTGGTIGQKDSSTFAIVKAGLGYKLLYCPSYQCPPCPPSSLVCPCPAIGVLCQAVGQVFQNGKRSLAAVNGPGLTWNFRKV